MSLNGRVDDLILNEHVSGPPLDLYQTAQILRLLLVSELEGTMSKPSEVNQGNWNYLPSIFICNQSTTLNRNSEKSLFFWKIRIFFIIGPYTAQQCVRAYSDPCVQQQSVPLYSGSWSAHWPFVPVECCACRAEVIIN